MYKKLSACCLVFVLSMMGFTAAHAITMDYEFDGTFDTGPLASQTFMGTFTLDGLTQGAAPEYFTPSGNNPLVTVAGTVTAFMVEVAGMVFSSADEVGFPDWPLIEATTADVSYIEFIGTLTTGEELNIFFDTLFVTNEVDYTSAAGALSTGTISRVGPSGVPEPGTIALLSLGLAGLGLRRCRKV